MRDSILELKENGALKRRIIEVAVFAVLYFVIFTLLEQRDSDVYIFHNRLDEIIPYRPEFIIPYVLWFPYMALSVLYFLLLDTDGTDYKRMTRPLAFGCVIFLIISFLFPNGQDLRPDDAGKGFFADIVSSLYKGDTATNVFPSLHVYNSMAACYAWLTSRVLKGHTVIKILIALLSVSIVLSTMFVKQHSSIDVAGGLALNVICIAGMYLIGRRRTDIRRDDGV